MNIFAPIEFLFPEWAMKRAAHGEMKRYYQAAQNTDYHKRPIGGGASADAVMDNAHGRVRDRARLLDENHDLTVGVLNDLCTKILGSGLQMKPFVRNKSGDLQESLNDEIHRLWLDWSERPEVTREYSFGEVQRQVCRSWLRDGEVFAHFINSDNRLAVPSEVKFSLELLEADYVPFDYTSLSSAEQTENLVHGVEKDAWGKPRAYHVLKEHPGNSSVGNMTGIMYETKRVSAANMLHLKFTRRVRQTRGISILHSVILRMDDINDYEQSERIAARIAASFTAMITKDIGYQATVQGQNGDRRMEMNPGMIWDNLMPGEKVETIGTERPNANLKDFRNAMLRAVAAGTETNYSSIAKSYDGTYSSQRQELMEAKPAYDRLRAFYVDHFLGPVYRQFIDIAEAQGLIRVPLSVNRYSLYHPMWSQPAMPWIDPKKEMESFVLGIDANLMSRSEVIRNSGRDPQKVFEEIEREQDEMPELPQAQQANEAQPATDEPATDDTDEEQAA